MNVKTLPGDIEKIARIQNLVSDARQCCSHPGKESDCATSTSLLIQSVNFPRNIDRGYGLLLIPAHEVSAAPDGEDSKIHHQQEAAGRGEVRHRPAA